MMLTEGMSLPDATVLEMIEDEAKSVSLADKLKARRVVIFAVPGAFTPTCDAAHLPSFIRTADAFRQKGVDEIICISVNDAYVMGLWGKQSGATDAGITMLADGSSEFTKAVGMAYSSPKSGMLNRSRRYAMLVEDGVVKVLHLEASTGICEVSGGEAMLAAI
jgi:glutaredoxin/glutathione-dependent peroxiredoxin